MSVMSAADHRKMAPLIPKIKSWASKRNIPYDMLYRQVWKESAGNPKAVGDFGNSRGLLQINKNSAGKELNADFNKLFDVDYNLDIGTQYILKVRSLLAHLLPSNQSEAWAMIFMAYNSGYGYMKKALERLRAKGITQPTLAQAVNEMNVSGFGRTPIFSITVPYALFVAKGIKTTAVDYAKAVTKEIAKKPQVSLPLLLGLGAIAFYALKMKRQGARG